MFNSTPYTSYIKHLFTANTLHGTHSPFVYDLIDNVIYDKSPKDVYTEIEKQRKNLLDDERIITITDLGAGSHYNNNKQKKVKVIADKALKAPKWAQLIYRLATWRQPKQILELGTCFGITTSYLAKSNENIQVISVEGCPQTAAVANQSLSSLQIKNVNVEIGNFDDLLPQLVEKADQLDFVYVDGNHRKEATLNYFHSCLEKANENSLFIFDDIHWSKGMEEAWEEIKKHPTVTLTIDLYTIGLVFFRKGQVKEHFKIKY
ncbi:class I SAM-dependent methyltransferase [Solitalea sp. MAHUQ-68]|uniref:Class I SAM-dependent methyltransferase n=1 Tax=Solitalea agri TaxID=2953739 RepID=A0A9X2JDB2_9SPHI|nr:class I SAM-dependent methyltransferase [Solitalea agri]MCO4293439.1 class I SAM-dependent methyltransferase [Solitalea agri]